MAKLERWVYTLQCHCGRERVLGVSAVHGRSLEDLLTEEAEREGWRAGIVNPHDLCPQHNNIPILKTDPTGLVIIP